MSVGSVMNTQADVVTRDALSLFRSTQPGCVLAIWADIEARVVLAVDSDLRFPQESLDAFCNQASGVLGPSSEMAPESAIFAEPTGSRLFLRDVTRTPHALICTSAPGGDPIGLLDAMHRFLTHSVAQEVTA